MTEGLRMLIVFTIGAWFGWILYEAIKKEEIYKEAIKELNINKKIKKSKKLFSSHVAEKNHTCCIDHTDSGYFYSGQQY